MVAVKQRLILQLQYFCLATATLTRLPVHHLPASLQSTDASALTNSKRYYPAVGALIGLLLSAVFWLSTLFLPLWLAACCVMIASLCITGGFHEDGLADCIDGFYGGFDTAKKLQIMKDSAIGSYGSLALWSVLSFKLIAIIELSALNAGHIVLIFVIAQTLSRAISVSMIFLLSYVSVASQQKFSQLSDAPSRSDGIVFMLSIALCFTLAYLLLQSVILSSYFALLILLTTLLLAGWQKHHIHGYTGDTLGACQQLSELVIYAFMVSIYASHSMGHSL
ncbi:MAG: adenosylcobinamide-GDP ribazoletransferase [Pseudomonadales bacterium]|nr:adenosylcobinamide-GDP ribazoletransferase [Pseudomonadales bacterium]